ncbi:unnamed protein product, partial [Vitis vinifera]
MIKKKKGIFISGWKSPQWFLSKSSFCQLNKLQELYLSYNLFQGILPPCLNNLTSLRLLDLSSNLFSGNLSSSLWIGNMTHLTTLVLGNNSFKGKLPPDISQLQRLKFLDVSQNVLSGSLPSLKSLDLSNLEMLDLSFNSLSGIIPSSIRLMPHLKSLSLAGNYLNGSLQNQGTYLHVLFSFVGFCQLNKLQELDLSYNLFQGILPPCLNNFTSLRLLDISANLFSGNLSSPLLPNLTSLEYIDLSYNQFEGSPILVYNEKDEVDFVTKNRRDSYKGGILEFMSGLDLSCNNLTGEIPHELGMLSWIRALNLSHNQLNGSIPKSFSNLSQIESLDLSYNKLGGEIPLELVELNFLEVFSVAYNNISGRVPDTKAQFATFDESNYEGNPFLCGELLKRKCNTSIDFTTSYIIILLGFATILYINPYWRHRWFNFIEECIYSCYYFVSDSLSKLSTYLINFHLEAKPQLPHLPLIHIPKVASTVRPVAMKAVVITTSGDPQVLQVQEVENPEIGDDEVLIRVDAAAIYRADKLQRKGLHPSSKAAVPTRVSNVLKSSKLLEKPSFDGRLAIRYFNCLIF